MRSLCNLRAWCLTPCRALQSSAPSRAAMLDSLTPKGAHDLAIFPPEHLFTVTIGRSRSNARFCVDGPRQATQLLTALCGEPAAAAPPAPRPRRGGGAADGGDTTASATDEGGSSASRRGDDGGGGGAAAAAGGGATRALSGVPSVLSIDAGDMGPRSSMVLPSDAGCAVSAAASATRTAADCVPHLSPGDRAVRLCSPPSMDGTRLPQRVPPRPSERAWTCAWSGVRAL